MKKINVRKQFCDSRKEAIQLRDLKNVSMGYGTVNRVFKMTYGRHKGQYFVGSDIEYLNIY